MTSQVQDLTLLFHKLVYFWVTKFHYIFIAHPIEAQMNPQLANTVTVEE